MKPLPCPRLWGLHCHCPLMTCQHQQEGTTVTDTITTPIAPAITPETTPGTLPVAEPDWSATDAVARGIDLLDSHIPGWAGQIDLDTLDIAEPKSCILGQLGGGGWMAYGHMLDTLGIHEDWDAQVSHGFEHPQDSDDACGDYEVLTALWANEVAVRQGRTDG